MVAIAKIAGTSDPVLRFIVASRAGYLPTSGAALADGLRIGFRYVHNQMRNRSAFVLDKLDDGAPHVKHSFGLGGQWYLSHAGEFDDQVVVSNEHLAIQTALSEVERSSCL